MLPLHNEGTSFGCVNGANLRIVVTEGGGIHPAAWLGLRSELNGQQAAPELLWEKFA